VSIFGNFGNSNFLFLHVHYILNIFIFKCKIISIDTLNTKFVIQNQSWIDNPKGLYISTVYKNYCITSINLKLSSFNQKIKCK